MDASTDMAAIHARVFSIAGAASVEQALALQEQLRAALQAGLSAEEFLQLLRGAA